MNPKPYALLICHNLRVVTFYSKDGVQDAIAHLRLKNLLFIPLKWNAGAQTYVQQEVLE